MPKRTKDVEGKPKRKLRPTLSPEAQESRLISLAMDAAESQLLDGTASSQIIAHFLKLGTAKAQLECEKLRKENALLEAKRSHIESMERSEELFKKALAAFPKYQGRSEESEEFDGVDEYE